MLLRLLPMSAVTTAAAATAIGACNAWVVGGTRGRAFAKLEDVPKKYVALVPGAPVRRRARALLLEDRLAAALSLYQAGRVKRILASGDPRARDGDEVAFMLRWLRKHGVPDADIFLDRAGYRTLDTMQRAARVFGVREAVVCTQYFHLARALWLAGQAGIDAVGLVADRGEYAASRRTWLREIMARAIAVGDVYLWKGTPSVLGPVVPIDGRSPTKRVTTG